MNTSFEHARVWAGWAGSCLAVAFAAAAPAGCSDPDTLRHGRATLAPADGGPQVQWVADGGVDAGAEAGPVSSCGPFCSGPHCDQSCGTNAGSQRCGDSRLAAHEECDDGNVSDDDSCSRYCLVIDCGNGRVDPGETCDRRDPTCSAACQSIAASPTCGDGELDELEECDDGATVAGDGCSDGCLIEACPNQRLDALEECDPPDDVSCNTQCRHIQCGDGDREGVEACDDGNTASGDGCSSACTLEIACGNGRLEPGEDCEPPGSVNCGADCRAVRVHCGDGLLHATEECDDGNLAFGDGCSPGCQREACGNGRIEAPGEQCEPPSTASCNARCQRRRCGDGDLTPPLEACEDGNLTAGDGCSADCRVEFCGNGVLEAPEQCEPPGTAACDASCRARSTAGLELPRGGAAFRLHNPGFDGTLEGWTRLHTTPATVRLNSNDVDGVSSSGSLELGSAASPPISESPLPGVMQCIRTASGVAYRLTVAASALEGAARPQLRARFYDDVSCNGTMLDGVASAGTVRGAVWSTLSLPPPSPLPGHSMSFSAPPGARSLALSLELSNDPEDGPARVLLDRIDLLRASPPRCGDGLPEVPEECEPSTSAGCLPTCRLVAICGDGVAAPSECGASGSCPADCAVVPAVCGDGLTTTPEECDPPAAGLCGESCTRVRSSCGNARLESGEECDPPNGWTCSAQCQSMRCGDGVVEDAEQCEPPGSAECSVGCRRRAALPSNCGDGLLQGAEECEPPSAATWCSAACTRRNPAEACGDGRVDADLGEQCDPPGYASHCGHDCRTPVCGDGAVTGGEQCEPRADRPGACSDDCRHAAGKARECHECLARTCDAPDAELFSACFELDGVARSGTALGQPLSALCADAVECMRQTGCAVEKIGTGLENPLACYCGKSVLTQATDGAEMARRMRECRDGIVPARGACRDEFERAAEASINPRTGRAFPASVLAASTSGPSSKPALRGAIRLMTECGHAAGECVTECSVVPACGDGVVGIGEACDPRDPDTRERCDEQFCSVLPCGNGVIDPGETCDVADPYTKGRCDADCQLQVECGDGRFSASVEACDGSVPGSSWDNCCRWSALGPPAHASHLAGCDRNANGLIDENEACKFPQVCGNGIQEGTEQCDDGGAVPAAPAVDSCDAECKRIETDDCSLCSKEYCDVPQRADCFRNPQPSSAAACGAVYDCIQTSRCVNADGLIEPCLCGDLDPFDCATAPTRQGPCADIMTRNSGCDASDPACVWTRLLSPVYPLGLATQLVQCQVDFCFDQCVAASP